jgi:glycosyltransferase involved in cell wall biosynthesis
MKNTKQTIYIYRGSITGGGCSKIINDLLKFLSKLDKYNLVLISYISTDLDIDEDENGNLIPIKRITIPLENYWRSKICSELSNHVDKQENPVLISFLDFNSNRFIAISEYILRDNVFWINFDTNHPTKIINAFQTKNEGVGITYTDLCDATDIIRLENKNFKKYIPGDNQEKIRDFWNTVDIPKCSPIKFEKKFNLININGLREGRKSILPLVKVMPELIESLQNFTLHIIGDINPTIEKELELIFQKNPEIKNYISVKSTVKNIHDYYSSCDFMVSTAEFEGTSNAVIEALSHELPVLCLKTSLGINETIDHLHTGFHCKDPMDMNSRIRQLCNDQNKLIELKNNCKKLKNELTNPEQGTLKYVELINERKISHNKDARQKLKQFSKEFFSRPSVYRQKLDALILYCDLDKHNETDLQHILKTKAYHECKECLFIVKYKTEKQITDFSSTFESCSAKNKILSKFIYTPHSVSEYTNIKSSTTGLILLSENENIKKYCLLNSLETAIYYDCTIPGKWWLEKYENHLQKLTEWHSKDSWLWMVGSMDVVKNNCCFLLNSWFNFGFSLFLSNCNNQWFMKNKKIVNDINLPKEVMRKIRHLY